MKIIELKYLKQLLANEKPLNEDRTEGYSLVNVLDQKSFITEHIPGSINIPKGQEEEFEKRFDKSKEIIVYCGSSECPASSEVAEKLTHKGFRNVVKFEVGMKGWKESDNQVERGLGMHGEVHPI